MTSHSCVARVRRFLQTKKVGHGGTLDPLATGVLPLAVGRATRLLPYLATGKAYQAVIRFGVTTTTDDLEGDVVTQHPASSLSLDGVRAVLPQFIGRIDQIPPRYSAVQVGGKRLYQLARKGTAVDVPTRQVEIKSIDILDWQVGQYPELTIAITCGTGTYIRSIARDWGEAVGTGATLVGLIRTHSNGFDLEESLSLETLEEQIAMGTLALIEPNQALRHLPSFSLPPDLAKRWCQGQKLLIQKIEAPLPPLALEQPYRLLNQGGQFLGIAVAEMLEDGKGIVPQRVFTPVS